ncbi:MAG: antitoxin [Candidatus Sericytochromatia bacterium]|nr:antitoxin [Candidatus Tanganyikabacteria bacterium]
MRTTLNIDDDVLAAAKERARRERRSAGEVLSELARRGLTASTGGPGDGEGEAFFGFRPLRRRTGTIVTTELIDRLRDEGPY